MDQGNRQVSMRSGLRLAIELGIEVSIDSPRISGRFRSELVGMLPGRYLILSEPGKPVSGPYHAEYREGDSVVVRYLFRGSIFGFRTFVLGSVIHPDRLLFLGYPTQVEEHNIRAAKRLECLIPSLIAFPDGTESKATMVDVSRVGCHIRVLGPEVAGKKPERGDAVRIRCRVPGVEEDQIISGEIKRLIDEGDRLGIGVGFHQPEEQVYLRIYDFLSPALE
ncbi:MAG: flagellar brake protein [Gammaproteobacteria bacterium]|nr:MAG: flagellar brake protein [Gammaproteobacteria bacterium]